jgi:hypothetical protein
MAKGDWHRRHGITRLRCRARTTTTGEQCKRWATPGSAVCVKHGSGQPMAQWAALPNMTLAELLALNRMPRARRWRRRSTSRRA